MTSSTTPNSTPHDAAATTSAPAPATPSTSAPSSVPQMSSGDAKATKVGDTNSQSTHSTSNHSTTPTDTEPQLSAASATEALSSNPTTAFPLTDEGKKAVEDGALPPMSKEEMIQEALNCPCIASMKDGPCGSVFLTAYECFLRSDVEPKGSDCVSSFVKMHDCMTEHPEVYDE